MSFVFEDLVRKISVRERKEMLAKIERKNQINTEEPLCRVEPNDNQPIVVQAEFSRLPFFWRLYVLIGSFFSQRKHGEVTEGVILHLIRKKVNREIPDFFDFRNSLVKSKFYNFVLNLKSIIDLFRQPVLDAMGKEKADFIALLAKFEFPELYVRLQDCVEPDRFIFNNPSVREQDPGEKMEIALEEEISQIDNLKRNVMKVHIQVLTGLYFLVRFPYIRMLNFFPSVSQIGMREASLKTTGSLILELCDAMYSFRSPPSTRLLEVLFIFGIKEQLDYDDIKIEQELSNMIVKSRRALEDIRNINSKIPWSDMVKAVSGDIHHTIGLQENPEDWYDIFKKFWKDAQKIALSKWSNNKQIRACVNDLLLTWGMASLPMLSGYRSSEYPDNIHIRFEFTIAALSAMFSFVFSESLYHALNLIRMDGKFYKRNNQKEFKEVLAELKDVSVQIQSFESRLSFDGELGITSLKIRKTYKGNEFTEQMKNFVKKIDDECHAMIMPVIAALKVLCNLVGGILEGDQGSYDTLSNLSEIGGQGHKVFRKNLEEVYRIIRKSTQILNDLLYLEEKRRF